MSNLTFLPNQVPVTDLVTTPQNFEAGINEAKHEAIYPHPYIEGCSIDLTGLFFYVQTFHNGNWAEFASALAQGYMALSPLAVHGMSYEHKPQSIARHLQNLVDCKDALATVRVVNSASTASTVEKA